MGTGIGEYLNPSAHGKDPMSGGFFVDPLMTFIQAYGLRSRVLCGGPCRSAGDCCNKPSNCYCKELCIGGQVI